MQALQLLAGLEIGARLDALAEAVTARHYERRPDLEARYGPAGRVKCRQDAAFHLSYLAEAVAVGSPALFADYVAWAKVMLAARGIPAHDLAVNLEVLLDTLRQDLPDRLGELAGEFVAAGLARLPRLPDTLPPLLDGGEPLGDLARGYLAALLAGERHVASRLVLDAVERGADVRDVYVHVFQRCQREIGRLWQMNQVSVAQEHYATAATQLIMSQLYPQVFAAEKRDRTLVATCVTGDLHEIGVRMVCDFFEMAGWHTFYLGANAPAASVVQTLVDRRADVLAVSATLTSHVGAVAALTAAVRAAVGERVKVLVGGYPFNVDPELWRRVGADACAGDAREVVALAEGLLDGLERGPELPREEAAGEVTGPAGAGDRRGDRLYAELSRLNNELATAQRELARSNAELVRLNEQKNQLLGIAAHDLRNPLGIILTYSGFLLDEAAGRLDREHAAFLHIIQRSSDFMLTLVNDLLDVAKIEAGRLDLDRRPVDLAALVERNVALNRTLAGKKGIRVLFATAGDLPRLPLDGVRIEQVLNNLIGNAVKFSPPGTTVEVRLEPAGDGRVCLAVRDQGEGVPAEALDRIFRPFERGHAAGTGGEKGAGLGLAIVKKIVEGHGGEIRVESGGERGGSTFSILLPVSFRG